MHSSFSPTAYSYRPSPRSRATALGLSLGICALIVAMLIQMGAFSPHKDKPAPRMTAITISPRAETPAAVKTHTIAASAPKAAEPKPTPPEIKQPQPATPVPPAFIQLSRDEFAAADISRMPKRAAAGGQAGGTGTAYGPGEGPGGSKLYNAEWYREPTDAEIATYLPKRRLPNGGWATIACRMEERYHVSDCRELAESPPGSGLSRAMRQAAWQFLVRPPRIDGKPLLGTWVRIRFDFTVKPAPDDASTTPD
ncbi:MAG: hypothetical protein QM676_09040 [Novosphingobium sp.]